MSRARRWATHRRWRYTVIYCAIKVTDNYSLKYFYTMKKKALLTYESPEIELLEVEVERGMLT